MSRTSPDSGLSELADKLEKRASYHTKFYKGALTYFSDNDAQLLQEAAQAMRGLAQTPTDAAHVRSALETLSDTSKISVDGTGIDRLINLIDRMRQIAATALLRLPEVSDTSTDRTSK
jgi:hypothetical protein